MEGTYHHLKHNMPHQYEQDSPILSHMETHNILSLAGAWSLKFK